MSVLWGHRGQLGSPSGRQDILALKDEQNKPDVPPYSWKIKFPLELVVTQNAWDVDICEITEKGRGVNIYIFQRFSFFILFKCVSSFEFFLATPMTCGSSQARDQTCATP